MEHGELRGLQSARLTSAEMRMHNFCQILTFYICESWGHIYIYIHMCIYIYVYVYVYVPYTYIQPLCMLLMDWVGGVGVGGGGGGGGGLLDFESWLVVPG